jgi:hypothetical protein
MTFSCSCDIIALKKQQQQKKEKNRRKKEEENKTHQILSSFINVSLEVSWPRYLK